MKPGCGSFIVCEMRAFIPYVFGIVLILGAVFFRDRLSASIQDNEQYEDRKNGNGMTLREIACRKLHHRENGFSNPWNHGEHGRFLDVLKWKLFSRNEFRHLYRYERVSPVHIDWEPVKTHPGLSVTFITHATVLIKDGDASLLIDPVLDGLFWPIKNFTPLAFDVSDMPEPDYVLITHGHYDHLDAGSIQRFGRCSRFITPHAIGSFSGNTAPRPSMSSTGSTPFRTEPERSSCFRAATGPCATRSPDRTRPCGVPISSERKPGLSSMSPAIWPSSTVSKRSDASSISTSRSSTSGRTSPAGS
ncbi:hypothetical protein SCFA_510006 [anaerobic digester metagenome]|uniref:Metallo-beta-lactamase domain-containing protein n=1 Tax=anaerobic digester metagenome TaxID=1263854 RepID=A0A485M8U0_9ZZZZ